MEFLKKVGEVILMNIAILGFLLLAPVIYLTLPFILIVAGPNGKHNGLAFIYMLLGPFAASAWTIITRMVSRYRRITADGTPYERSWKGVGIACGWMVVGFIVSVVTECVFLGLWHCPSSGSEADWTLWFAVAPFATFAPVLIGWAWPAKAKCPEKVFGAPVRGTDEMAKMADDGKEIV